MAGNKSFMTSLLDLLNDNDFRNKVMSKHFGTEKVDVKDHLSLVEKILAKGDQTQNKSSTSPSHVDGSSAINELCCKITCEALHAKDAHQTMISLFDKLSSFSWDVKAVLTLSAFSVYYAEHWFLVRHENSEDKLGSAAVLRGQRAGMLDFKALDDLIKETLEFTKYTVKFVNSEKFSAPPTSIDIGAIFYQIIFGVIGCSVTFSGMITTRNEIVKQDLLTFSKRVTTKYEYFKKQMEEYGEKRQYKKLKELYSSPAGIVEFVAEMCCTKDSRTVYQCVKKTTVKVEQLQKKNVMLLISGLTLSNEDLTTLKDIYNQQFKSGCEILWVPIADEKHDKQFQLMRSQMLWYSCNSIVSKGAAKFIRKWWQFKQQTKVVVLNEEGKKENLDAMSMIRLWGSEALPFTWKRGSELWEEHRNDWLKLVVNDKVFQSIKQSWEKNELIYLYGSAEDSENIEQIKKMLSSEIYASFNFKFFNIGNTERKQFHSRLENYISWRMQVDEEKSDSQTLTLLELYTSYMKQSGFFAIIESGSSVSDNSSLTDLWKVLSEHEKWIKDATNTKGFDTHFLKHSKKVIEKTQCNQFSIPNMVGDIPEFIKCPNPKCTLNMETVVTFKCCHGAH